MKIIGLLAVTFVLQSCDVGINLNPRSSNTQRDGDDFLPDNSTPDDSGGHLDVGAGADPATLGEDPLFSQSWHLRNTGQRSFSQNGGREGEDINLGALHERGIIGSGIKIAISDNGVDLTHPEFSGRVLSGLSRSYAQSSSSQWHNRNPAPTSSGPSAAHGTAVSGLAIASGWNEQGSRGVAPGAGFAGFNFVGNSLTTAKMVDQARGPFDLYNYSYGRDTCAYSFLPRDYLDQLRYGAFHEREGLGALYVKAGGNEYISRRSYCRSGAEGFYTGYSNLEEDNNQPWVITVGAIDSFGHAAFYSTPGSSLFISAPGGDLGVDFPALISTDLVGCHRGYARTEDGLNDFDRGSHPLNSNCAYTSTMNGTSSAAPIVTGAIALMIQANPSLSWRAIRTILASTARKVDSAPRVILHPLGHDLPGHRYLPHWITNQAGFNFHHWYGHGVIDVERAVEMAENYNFIDGAWVERTRTSGEVRRSIPDFDSEGVEDTIVVNDELILEALQVRLTINHSYLADLGVELTSPSGTTSVLLPINSGIVDQQMNGIILASHAFFHESSQGPWTLKVVDGAQEDTGQLVQWDLILMGHRPGEQSIQPRDAHSELGRAPSHRQHQENEDGQDGEDQVVFSLGPKESTESKTSLNSSSSMTFTERSTRSGGALSLIGKEVDSSIDQYKLNDKEKFLGPFFFEGHYRGLFLQGRTLFVRDLEESEVYWEYSLRAGEHFLGLDNSIEQPTIFTQHEKTVYLVRGPMDRQSLDGSEVSQQLLSFIGQYRLETGRIFVFEVDEGLYVFNEADKRGRAFSLEGQLGRALVLEGRLHLPVMQDQSLALYELASGGLEKLVQHQLDTRFFDTHLHYSEDEQSWTAVALFEDRGSLKPFGARHIGVFTINREGVESLIEFITDGAEILNDSLYEGGQLLVLATTRTNFIQENFGHADIVFIQMNPSNVQQKYSYHWGREQKLIDGDKDQNGLKIVQHENSIDLWGEMIEGPSRRSIFKITLESVESEP